MQITSAEFVRGINGTDKLLESAIPQVAFIGRSNVGKSSVINSLTGKKGLAITSSFPGRTRQINLFLINKKVYLLDLPGYGYAKASHDVRETLFKLIDWYLFKSGYEQKKVVLIVDAFVGPTADDLEILGTLEEYEKPIVIVANKVDKIKKSKYEAQLQLVRETIGNHKVIPYSSETKVGFKELAREILT
jgi:GTP-binding protein